MSEPPDPDAVAIDLGEEITPFQASVDVHLANMAAALLHMSGVAVAEVNEWGSIALRRPTEEEKSLAFRFGDPGPRVPSPRVMPGQTKALMGDGAAVSWVFTPPAPHNTEVEIVCSPEAASPIGMRCYAVRRFPGAERRFYEATWVEDEARRKT
jgi:hypothetical protein